MRNCRSSIYGYIFFKSTRNRMGVVSIDIDRFAWELLDRRRCRSLWVFGLEKKKKFVQSNKLTDLTNLDSLYRIVLTIVTLLHRSKKKNNFLLFFWFIVLHWFRIVSIFFFVILIFFLLCFLLLLQSEKDRASERSVF